MKKGLIALIYIALIVVIAIMHRPKEGAFTGRGVGYVESTSDKDGWGDSSAGGEGAWSGSSGGGGGGPSGPASSRSRKARARHRKIAGFNSTVRSYQSDYQKNKSANRYKKWYIPGTYKTSVLVYRGDVYMTPYDKTGPQYDKGYGLIMGQKHSAESALK